MSDITRDGDGFVGCRETIDANMDVKDGGNHLEATEVQICSALDSSNVFLADNMKESKESDDCCGETNVDHTEYRSDEELVFSCKLIYENAPQETAEDGEENGSLEDEPEDDDFSAKDLLRFAWQIARGMVIISKYLVASFCMLPVKHYNRTT